MTSLPKGLTVSLSNIDHGYSVTADAQVSWPPIGEHGGPLTVSFQDGALVLLTPSNSGTYPSLRFYLRGVGYNVRCELYQRPDGTWDIGEPGKTYYQASVTKYGASYNDSASDAARRDVTAILRQVGLDILKAYPDLPLAGARVNRLHRFEAADNLVIAAERALREAKDAKIVAAKLFAEAEEALYTHQHS